MEICAPREADKPEWERRDGRCRIGWHRWIVLPLLETNHVLTRICRCCPARQIMISDQRGLTLEWRTVK